MPLWLPHVGARPSTRIRVGHDRPQNQDSIALPVLLLVQSAGPEHHHFFAWPSAPKNNGHASHSVPPPLLFGDEAEQHQDCAGSSKCNRDRGARPRFVDRVQESPGTREWPAADSSPDASGRRRERSLRPVTLPGAQKNESAPAPDAVEPVRPQLQLENNFAVPGQTAWASCQKPVLRRRQQEYAAAGAENTFAPVPWHCGPTSSGPPA